LQATNKQLADQLEASRASLTTAVNDIKAQHVLELQALKTQIDQSQSSSATLAQHEAATSTDF
jgi:hypothetical protein